jgi:hypothetical protein
MAALAPVSSLPRCRGQEVRLTLCAVPRVVSLIGLSPKQENDDHDHQQQAESTAKQMEWRPKVKPPAAENENKENQKQN